MFHLLINFSVITFICYAVSGSVKTILFGGKKKAKRLVRRNVRTATRRTAAPRPYAATARRQTTIIPFQRKRAARRKLRAA